MAQKVHFFEEDASLPEFIHADSIEKGLMEIAHNHGSSIENLNYIFCSDDYLLEINKNYLDHDYYTDIITFPYQQGKIVQGDVFISVDRVTENALLYGNNDIVSEFLRVIAHGLLHLIGFKDKEEKDIQAMRLAENNAIQSLTLLLPPETNNKNANSH